MRYLIIGLGIYGSNLAIDLTNMGHEVIGADINANIVESIKDNISAAYVVDSTDESAIKLLPLSNVDVVIVAIGENFGASIRTVAILKALDVKHIFARAVDPLHESILQGFHIDRIITPEQRAASDLVLEMELGGNVESLRVDNQNFILRFKVPAFFVGMKYTELDLDKGYGISLIAVTRQTESTNILGMSAPRQFIINVDADADTVVSEGDTFICLGSDKAFRNLCRAINP